jgi:uncharacterized membrane protein
MTSVTKMEPGAVGAVTQLGPTVGLACSKAMLLLQILVTFN